jgi:uncharacterized repeat protein (TIGR03803 family)
MKSTKPASFLVAALALAAITFSVAASAQIPTENVLFDFGNGTGGSIPGGGLVFDSADNLYGVAAYGGNPDTCKPNGCGVIYELSPSSSGWTETVLHTFSGGWDGANSKATLLFDAAGNLYGTTSSGGDASACTDHNCGVVFKLAPQSDGTWKETVLHAFTGGKDGANPNGTLAFDAAGNLYGTTYVGGSTTTNCFPSVGCGVVFELSPTTSGPWKETTLHVFSGGSDGGQPLAGVTLNAAGNLFGATKFGGYEGNGTVYRIARTSTGHWQETVLYEFQALSSTDGRVPTGNLTFDAKGNLYGTTTGGGTSGLGTVFELSRPTSGSVWSETLLHQFAQFNDGSIPAAGVVFDSAGNLWGTTLDSYNYNGSVYELSPVSGGSWNESIFYFDVLDGGAPTAGLIFDSAGNLYGTTTEGGDVGAGYGVVFQIVP